MNTKTETRTAGAKLVPDLKKHQKGIVGKHWYWIGALPGCPREHLDIGSVDFPKMVERVSIDPNSRDTRRVPLIGSVRQLTLVQLKKIEADLPNCVIRFEQTFDEEAASRVKDAAKCDDDSPAQLQYGPVGGPGSTLEALDVVRRKGHPIRIPTDKAVDEAKKAGRHLKGYSPDLKDEPAADYVFAVLCSDQNQPQRSDFYPEPLSVTGLEWPDKQE